MRLIVEETLEAEVSDELGRGYYDRAGSSGRGQRNGYRSGIASAARMGLKPPTADRIGST